MRGAKIQNCTKQVFPSGFEKRVEPDEAQTVHIETDLKVAFVFYWLPQKTFPYLPHSSSLVFLLVFSSAVTLPRGTGGQLEFREN